MLYNKRHSAKMYSMTIWLNLIKQIFAEFGRNCQVFSNLARLPNPLRLNGTHLPSLYRKTARRKKKSSALY